MVKSQSAPPAKFVFAANLWSLVEHPTPKREWSLARKVKAVADAGFDAVTTLPSPEVAKLARQHGLRFMGFSSTGKVSEFRSELAASVAAGAELVNVQLGDECTLPPEGTRTRARRRILSGRAAEVGGPAAADDGHPLYPTGLATIAGLTPVLVAGLVIPLVYDASNLYFVVARDFRAVLSREYAPAFKNDEVAIKVSGRFGVGCPGLDKTVRKLDVTA